MAYITPPSRAAGYTITAGDWNQDVRANMQSQAPDIFTAVNQIGYSTAADTMAAGALPMVMGGRLTLETGVAVSTADQADKTTLYWTPYGAGAGMATVFDGTKWIPIAFDEMSDDTTGFTTSKPHDIFLDYNGGTPVLDKLVWTDDTTRATALAKQNGRYVLTGALDWNYLGTVYLDSADKFQDTTSQRFLWNYYNRIWHTLYGTDPTDTWSYATAAWRASNNNTTDGVGRVSLVIGVSEDNVEINAVGIVNPTAVVKLSTGIGINSTSVSSAQLMGVTGGGSYEIMPATYSAPLPIGYSYIQWLEYGGTGAVWQGDGNAPTEKHTGIIARVKG